MDLEKKGTRIKEDQDVMGKQELVFKCSCGRCDADAKWKIPKVMLTLSFLLLFFLPPF